MSFIVQFKTIDASCESLLKKEENKAELTNSFFYFSYILGSICYLIGLCLLIHSFLGYS